jgi:hypothetical protein
MRHKIINRLCRRRKRSYSPNSNQPHLMQQLQLNIILNMLIPPITQMIQHSRRILQVPTFFLPFTHRSHDAFAPFGPLVFYGGALGGEAVYEGPEVGVPLFEGADAVEAGEDVASGCSEPFFVDGGGCALENAGVVGGD